VFSVFVDGEWRPGGGSVTDDEGAVEREPTSFRDRIAADAEAAFPAEPNRYHLYVSYACPWAHRTLLTRRLHGLTDVVSVDVVDPYRDEDGWQFTPEKAGCTPDRVNGFDYLREAYVAAAPDYTGHVSVPVLWDTERGTIVNNESREIMRMLGAFDGNGADLCPPEYRAAVDETLDAIYEPINNGVYRAGFARSQAAYDRAAADLFDALDHWDDVLADQRYLVGDRLTEADVAMFTTLVRFDHVYHTHFKCNRTAVHEYESLWPYLRDVYQTPGVAGTVDLSHVTEHYYRTHPHVNPSRVVATGPDLDFDAPHDRDDLPGGPPTVLG
jgi:putative glutathione S-transferase